MTHVYYLNKANRVVDIVDIALFPSEPKPKPKPKPKTTSTRAGCSCLWWSWCLPESFRKGKE